MNDVQIIDAHGLTVIPGLIDVHVHATGGDIFSSSLILCPYVVNPVQ